MINVSITDLRINKAQMRTRVRAAELAGLVRQIGHGFDESLHLLVSPAGDAWDVVSGHRRWLAAMLAEVCKTDDVEGSVEAICSPDKEGWIHLEDALYTHLMVMIGDGLELPCELWQGSPDQEVLTLIKANLGGETPDLRGVAKAFHAAIERGVELEGLAAASGMPQPMVEAILLIPVLPEYIQGLVNDGRLQLEIVPSIEKLSGLYQKLLGKALETYELREDQKAPRLWDPYVEQAIAFAGYEPKAKKGDSGNIAEFNTRRIIRELWLKTRGQNAERLYEKVIEYALRGWNPGSRSGQVDILAKLPGCAKYFAKDMYGRVGLKDNAYKAMNLTCDTCKFRELPEIPLSAELDMPCQQIGKTAKGCNLWIGEDGFTLRTPWTWVKGGEVVTSVTALAMAMEKQRETEVMEGESPVEDEDAASPAMAKQRAEIQKYMDHHAEAPFLVDHPWASACSRCKWRLDKSPVKSAPNAPHCEWAKGRQTLTFNAFVIDDDDVYALPACMQFWPTSTWVEVIPDMQFWPTSTWAQDIPEEEAPEPAPPFDRDLTERMIGLLAKSINRRCYSPQARGAVQWLAPRPRKMSGRHQDSFKKEAKKQLESLSDGQAETLKNWLLLDWARTQLPTRLYVPLYDGRHALAQIASFGVALALWNEKPAKAKSKGGEDED